MTLNDICELIVDCPHSTAKDEGEGFPLIRTPNIGRGRLILDDVHRVSKEVYDKRNARAVPQDDDLILAREAPAGNVAIVKDGEQVCLGQRTVLIRPDKSKVYPDFLAYYILAPQQQYELLGTANGATVAHVNIPVIKSLPVDLPSLEDQVKIADILKAYDDLIETNQKQIRLLEEATQRIYKLWFKEFLFPGHDDVEIIEGIPVGWKSGRADDFFDITIGKTPPRAEKKWFVNGGDGVAWASISDMGAAGTYIFNTSEGLTEEAVEKHNMTVVPVGTILLSFKLTLGRVSITTKPMCTNEAIAHFRLNKSTEREYTYSYLKNFEYDTLGNTSSISKAVNSKIIKAMPFVIPSEGILEKYSALVAPLLDEVFNKQSQNLQLAEARDRLLPKLMSGEMEL